jgi:glycosyltransferase involved in cell wall biosynthesis
MPTAPLVSFIVLSYNNARYIRRTIDSIIAQTFKDFEVILIDDGSTDNSHEIIQLYTDERIKKFVYSQNLGLTPRYNEAISRASGNFLSNLDTDDVIHPEKTTKQLACFDSDPTLGVVGSYINLIDEHDQPHAQADQMEGMINRPYDFNHPAAWAVQNMLVRSSTMMRRQLHESVGPNELGMLRAPDYDLWTRGLQAGFRFHVIPERLTDYRLHSAGLTYGDPKATFLELSYSLLRRLLPVISALRDTSLIAQVFNWMTSDPHFLAFSDDVAARLAGLLVQGSDPGHYIDFVHFLENGGNNDSVLRSSGRRLLDINEGLKIQRAELLEAATWHREQLARWEIEAAGQKERGDKLQNALEAEKRSMDELREAVDWHSHQTEAWKREFEAVNEQVKSLSKALADAVLKPVGPQD